MEDLSLDNILSENQVDSLFSDSFPGHTDEIVKESETKEEESQNNNKDTDTEEITTTEAPIDELFGKPESVGSEDNKDEKDTYSTEAKVSSNFYSSIASALVEDGVLQNLDKETLSKVETADDFAEVINSYVSSQLNDRQRRIEEALNLGVAPTEVQKYENYISTLGNISDESLEDEGSEGETLRKNLIYQDCLNKGFSKEKAIKMTERSFKAGTDIDDAKDALNDNLEFYKEQYQSILAKAKQKEREEQEEIQKQTESFKNAILKEDKAFGDIILDKSTRQKVYDSIMKPVYTDEDGNKMSAIQKYEMEHRTEFLKNVGLLFVLTDGFKNINKLVDSKVKKETKSRIRELEHTLSKGGRITSGSMTFANNIGDNDPESLFKGWKLSI